MQRYSDEELSYIQKSAVGYGSGELSEYNFNKIKVELLLRILEKQS